jgi:general secretion pathway protein I
MKIEAPAKGFTLIEVLVALAILAIALSAVLRAGIVTTDQAQAIKYKLLAQWSAENLLAEQSARKRWPAPGVQTGSSDQAGIALDWEQTVSATPNAAFRRIEIKIFARQEHAYALAQIVGFLTDPAAL